MILLYTNRVQEETCWLKEYVKNQLLFYLQIELGYFQHNPVKLSTYRMHKPLIFIRSHARRCSSSVVSGRMQPKQPTPPPKIMIFLIHTLLLATEKLDHSWNNCSSKSVGWNRNCSKVKRQAGIFSFHLAFLKWILLALPNHRFQHSKIKIPLFWAAHCSAASFLWWFF